MPARQLVTGLGLSRGLVLICGLALIAAGCGSRSTATREPVDAAASDASIPDGVTVGDDPLAIPTIEPRPLVWASDYEPPSIAVTESRKAAMTLADEADELYRMTAEGESLAAVQNKWAEAIEADPSWPEPYYEAAVLHTVSETSLELIEFAAETGLARFADMVGPDAEPMPAVRRADAYQALLPTVRRNYITALPDWVGQAVAFRPEGEPPKRGWPIMLLLHGYGDTNQNWPDIAAEFTSRGFLTITVPGSTPLSPGRYRWSSTSLEATHADLQAAVNAPLLDGLANRESVYAFGFSQGGHHAIGVAASHPDDYAGVIVMSPALAHPAIDMTAELPATAQPPSVLFVYGIEELPAQQQSAAAWSERCGEAGWPFHRDLYIGGHHFPADFTNRLDAWIGFLKSGQSERLVAQTHAFWERQRDDYLATVPDIPIFDRKPPRWATEADEAPPADAKPDDAASEPGGLLRSGEEKLYVANVLKEEGDFEEAERLIREVLAEPSDVGDEAAYHLACLCAADNRPDEAIAALERAIERGFAAWPVMVQDIDLVTLQGRDDYAAALTRVDAAYRKQAPDWRLAPLAVKPSGERPADGWSVAVLLLPYGDALADALPHARLWADNGVLAIVLPGSVAVAEGRLAWDLLRPEVTQSDIDAALDSDLLAGLINRDRVLLMGLAQGGMHALCLGIDNPEDYTAVLACSPSGFLAAQRLRRLALPPTEASLFVGLLFGEDEGLGSVGELWRQALTPLPSDVMRRQRRHWPWAIEVLEHEENGRYPSNIDDLIERSAATLR